MLKRLIKCFRFLGITAQSILRESELPAGRLHDAGNHVLKTNVVMLIGDIDDRHKFHLGRTERQCLAGN